MLPELSVDDVDDLFNQLYSKGEILHVTQAIMTSAHDILSTEALKYVADYVAYKLKEQVY